MAEAIESLLVEGRTFPPPSEFVDNARITDPSVYEEANLDPEAFWARQASELIDWFKKEAR